MENNIEKKKAGLLQHTMANAVIIAIALIISSMVFFLTEKSQSPVNTVIVVIIILAGLVYSIKAYRNESLDGYISYGQSFGYSALISLFAGIIIGIYTFVFLSYVSPDIFEDLKQTAILQTEQTMFEANPNITDAELDTIIDFQLRFMTPTVMSIGSIASTTIIGLLLGLIVSIFLQRKNPEPFS